MGDGGPTLREKGEGVSSLVVVIAFDTCVETAERSLLLPMYLEGKWGSINTKRGVRHCPSI